MTTKAEKRAALVREVYLESVKEEAAKNTALDAPYTGAASTLGHVLCQAEHVQECLYRMLENLYGNDRVPEAAVTVADVVWDQLKEARKLCEIWEAEAVEAAIAARKEEARS